jgi:hypothetical protein
MANNSEPEFGCGYIILTARSKPEKRIHLSKVLRAVLDALDWNQYSGNVAFGQWSYQSDSVTIRFVATSVMAGMNREEFQSVSHSTATEAAARNLKASFSGAFDVTVETEGFPDDTI